MSDDPSGKTGKDRDDAAAHGDARQAAPEHGHAPHDATVAADDDIFVDLGAADEELPPAAGGSRGRAVLGGVILLVGLIVAVAAFAQRSSDDEAQRPVGQLVDQSLPEATTTTLADRVPTTIAGGVLPTGCLDWDGTFGFDPDPIEGVAIWSDFEGWHVRLGPDGPTSVTGTVGGQVVPVLSEQPLPPGVEVVAQPDAPRLVYSLKAGADPVGFDFSADCSQKEFTFEILGPDGAALPVDQIQIGRNGGAAAVPVIAQRTVAPG